ncbi:2,3-diaminopropionate biosynthesis protein SbnA [Zunongwangia sp. HRR-M8]|uniref:2,3-diaminopropionate biosynthesis protein SbnA n=1 Tax=Zunongwangia sp. HRR-M8 TaxID=3015170 RepID=UPI0022DE5BD3|nr:2,3-diaminopropionate biosynthesis protein SbnA [Zunongwangia sp. HRR-M8]WBL21584.1 2,3-diaminopropionate biosynthesis protein SbnA [Zunongwangia sp. HRR-M8]
MILDRIKNNHSIIDAIGDTPLIHLHKMFLDSKINFYGKLEAANPSGSLKDRTSAFILQNALEEGRIRPGDTVIESSSGNMALGLAQACLYLKLKLIVVVDPHINKHTEKLLLAYGAKIEYVTKPSKEGGFLAARLDKVQELLKAIPNSFWTNQYGNPDNPLAHHKTIEEIMIALEGDVDYIFVSASTCGTLMGYADYILENNLKTKLIAVDAKGSVLFGGEAKKRLIPGHGAAVPSQFLRKERIYDYLAVSDLDCIEGCWSLLKSEGILCGGSTGGVVTAIKKYSAKIDDSSNCVFLLCDKGERYLDTIYNPDWIQANFPDYKSIENSEIGW